MYICVLFESTSIRSFFVVHTHTHNFRLCLTSSAFHTALEDHVGQHLEQNSLADDDGHVHLEVLRLHAQLLDDHFGGSEKRTHGRNRVVICRN